MRIHWFAPAMVFATLTIAATAQETTKTASPTTTSTATPATQKEVTLPSGTKYVDTKVGAGATAQKGKTVLVHYTGTLTNGKKFDSSVDRGQPFNLSLGQGRVIAGWEEGIPGMREGGKRRLTIPPQQAYGERGFPPDIPPNSTLIFDIELLKVY